MSTKRKRGRPTIIPGRALTPTERKRRWREKAREEAYRLSNAEASIAPSQTTRGRQSGFMNRLKSQMARERHAYVTLLVPLNFLAEITEIEGKAAELLEQMSPTQRATLGKIARGAMPVLTFLAALPDDAAGM